jgi:hypothetical protein
MMLETAAEKLEQATPSWMVAVRVIGPNIRMDKDVHPGRQLDERGAVCCLFGSSASYSRLPSSVRKARV